MIDLKSMTLEEMGAYLKTGGEPSFRATGARAASRR